MFSYAKLPKNGIHLIILLSAGGVKGFSDVVWDVYRYKKDSHLTLIYNSYDGEQGILELPFGNFFLMVLIIYTVVFCS